MSSHQTDINSILCDLTGNDGKHVILNYMIVTIGNGEKCNSIILDFTEVCNFKLCDCTMNSLIKLINNHHCCCYLFSSCFDGVSNSRQSTAYVGFL